MQISTCSSVAIGNECSAPSFELGVGRAVVGDLVEIGGDHLARAGGFPGLGGCGAVERAGERAMMLDHVFVHSGGAREQIHTPLRPLALEAAEPEIVERE